LIRNVAFEPSENNGTDWVKQSLRDMETAFKWHKPAVISSHRVNYIGFIDEKNRLKTLQALKQLISSMLKKWPDIEFMSSDQLAALIRQQN
jgi:hypothetical protein